MKIVSAVFHPLLIATYLSSLLLLSAPDLFPRIMPQAIPQFILVIFITTCVMPAISIFLLRTFSVISSLELVRRSERIRPFLFIVCYYGMSSYLFSEKLGMGRTFMTIMVGVTVLIFILLLITLRFKISIHAAAIWSGAGYLSAIYVTHPIDIQRGYYLIILCAGLVSTSRLYLGYHTPKEVWYGALLGFGYSLLSFLIVA